LTLNNAPPKHTRSEDYHFGLSTIIPQCTIGAPTLEGDLTFFFDGQDIVGATLNSQDLDATTSTKLCRALTHATRD
jgi:hypothetical protein